VIYVVIPVHDRREVTRRCLQALREQTVSAQVIVVDDGSTDGTGVMLRRDFPEVQLLRGDGTLWWTGATNWACWWALRRASDDDAIVTLNDDTLPAPSWLAALTEAARDERHAVVGSLLADEATGLVCDAGTLIDWWTAKYQRPWVGRRPDELRRAAGACLAVDALSGCGTFFPVRALRELGPFCRALPHYGADFEYAIRASGAGWRVVVATDAVLLTSPQLSGIHHEASAELSTLARSLWSIHSANALRFRLRFALAACPSRALPVYLPLDVCRVLVGSGLRLAGIRTT